MSNRLVDKIIKGWLCFRQSFCDYSEKTHLWWLVNKYSWKEYVARSLFVSMKSLFFDRTETLFSNLLKTIFFFLLRWKRLAKFCCDDDEHHDERGRRTLDPGLQGSSLQIFFDCNRRLHLLDNYIRILVISEVLNGNNWTWNLLSKI